MAETPTPPAVIEFAPMKGMVAVLRLIGRCSHQNSAYLGKAAELCEEQLGPCAFVLDLERCEHMDSTFLGVLAGIAQRQEAQGLGRLIAVNVSDRLRRILCQLGLQYVLEIRDQAPAGATEHEVVVSETSRVELARADQIAHMIQAHQRLMELDAKNEVEFRDVVKHLKESFARAAEKKDEPR